LQEVISYKQTVEVRKKMKRIAFLFLFCFVLLLLNTANVKADGWTYNADEINPTYQKAFGRDAKTEEFAYWSRNDIRAKFSKNLCLTGSSGTLESVYSLRDKCANDSHKAALHMFFAQVLTYFNTPEGGPELKATIDRSYRAAFNRLPNPEELAYWQAEMKKGAHLNGTVLTGGYEYLIIQHKKWTQTSVKPEERLALINSAYAQVYGRAPVKKETDFWMSDIPKKGVLYADLCNYLKDWISQNGKEQIQDLEDVIKRAYAKAGVSGPNAEQMKLAMNQETSHRYDFAQLVEWVKKEGGVKPPAGAMQMRVPSLKR
jgi:hypothetical protein